MFFSTRFVLFQSIACSRCPSPDFIVPSNIDNIHIKHDKYVIMFLNIIYLLQLTHENHQQSNFLLTTNE